MGMRWARRRPDGMQMAPRWHQMAPRWHQMAAEGTEMAPRWHPDDTQMAPRWRQTAPDGASWARRRPLARPVWHTDMPLRAQGDTKFAQVLREEAPSGRTDTPLCGQVVPRCDQVAARAAPTWPTCAACGSYRRSSLCRRPSLPPLKKKRIACFLECGGNQEAREDPSDS